MDSFPLEPIRRSPLHHDRCLALLCGTADPASPLHSLRRDANILSMILDLVLPVWRAQAHAIDLVSAARNGLVREVHAKLHLTDVDVNAEDSRGAIAVHSAAYNGQAEALQLLLQCGGDPNRAIKNGSTAMHSASYSGHVDALRLTELEVCSVEPLVSSQRQAGWVPAVETKGGRRFTVRNVLQHRPVERHVPSARGIAVDDQPP